MSNALTRIKFGTDGWRAIMGKEFTIPNLERLAQAFAEFILKEGNQRRILGFSVIFTLMKLLQRDSEPLKGQVLRYDRGITDQFNSTVTYASIAFV